LAYFGSLGQEAIGPKVADPGAPPELSKLSPKYGAFTWTCI